MIYYEYIVDSANCRGDFNRPLFEEITKINGGNQMKRTIGIIIVLILTLITLTGCAEINYQVEVNKDGSGDISYIYGISKEILQKLNVSADDVVEEMKKQAEEGEYQVETYEDEKIAGFKATKYIEDLSKDISLQEAFGEEYVKDTENNGIKIEKSFFVTKYSQFAELDLTALNGNEQEITMNYQVKLPTKATKSNATEVLDNGKTLKWTLKSGEKNTIEFMAEEINSLPIIIIVVAGIAIVAVVVVFVVILKKKHATKKET